MNRGELERAVAQRQDLGIGVAKTGVDAIITEITMAIGRGEEVRIAGFGTFFCRNRKATTGRNPRTGEPVAITEQRQVKFRPAKDLKDVAAARNDGEGA